jgi:hypothetical protein
MMKGHGEFLSLCRAGGIHSAARHLYACTQYSGVWT